MIIFLFLIGFILGLGFSLLGEKLPLLLPEIREKEANSWILNLFIAIVNAVVALISYYEFGFSYEFLTSLIVSGLVINIFVSDFKYMIIMDTPLVIGGVAVLILKWCYMGFKSMLIGLFSGLFLFLFMLLIGYVGKKMFKREALGGGDVKLAAVIGIILGLRLGLMAIIFSSLLALPYALAAIMLGRNREVPFGPFLIGSMALVFIFSDKFMNLINFLV